MKKATAIARVLSEAKLKFDKSCKFIFSIRILLAWVLTSLKEFQDCDVNYIAETLIDSLDQESTSTKKQDKKYTRIKGLDSVDKSIDRVKVEYDHLFSATVPDLKNKLLIDIEAQKTFNPGYPLINRGILYCARMIDTQYNEGASRTYYKELKKVCSIWICLEPPKRLQNTIDRFEIQRERVAGNKYKLNPKKGSVNSDLMTVVVSNPTAKAGGL